MRIIHPKGYVGLEIQAGKTVVILGALDGRVPVVTANERHWLIEELRKIDDEL